MNKYQICNRCIMDTTDQSIEFDSVGNCSNCNKALEVADSIWQPDASGKRMLDMIFDKIKKHGARKDYDCVIGLSGGVDSSYLAYIAVKNKLRPLVVHVDCGWNSEEAVSNIENILKKLGLELHTFVVNWEEMKDLQRSFFKAGVPDLDIPQDHAIFAALYEFAARNDVRYVLNGYNFATESIMPAVWGHQAMDYRHLKAIQRTFGQRKLREYPHLSFFRRYIWFPLVKRMVIICPLNYMNYRKEEAMETLKCELGWKDYGGKHCESRFTKFFQGYYLPFKFNIDKRRGHLSSLIISGQISRAEALDIIKEEAYSADEIRNDVEFVAKKLDWAAGELMDIIYQSPHKHTDFPSNNNLFAFGISTRNAIRKLLK